MNLDGLIEKRLDGEGVGFEEWIDEPREDIYEDLFKTIWEKIVPTLGVMSLKLIMDRAISKTAEKYPAVTFLKVTDEGLDFGELRKQISSNNGALSKEAFKELMLNLFGILSKLTGNILIDSLIREVEGLEGT